MSNLSFQGKEEREVAFGRSMLLRRWSVEPITSGRVSVVENKAPNYAHPLELVFNSGFAEMAPTSINLPHGDSELSASPRLRGATGHTFSDNDSLLNVNTIEDSDEEDETMELDVDEPDDDAETEDNLDETESQHVAESEGFHTTVSMVTAGTQSSVDGEPSQLARPETEDEHELQLPEEESVAGTDEVDEPTKEVKVLSEISGRGSPAPGDPTMVPTRPSKKRKRDSTAVPGPPKTRVVVADVAYITYRAVLYYVRSFTSPSTSARLTAQYSSTRIRLSSHLSRLTLLVSIHWAVNPPFRHVRSPTECLLETWSGRALMRPLEAITDVRSLSSSPHWMGTVHSRPRGRSGSANGGWRTLDVHYLAVRRLYID